MKSLLKTNNWKIGVFGVVGSAIGLAGISVGNEAYHLYGAKNELMKYKLVIDKDDSKFPIKQHYHIFKAEFESCKVPFLENMLEKYPNVSNNWRWTFLSKYVDEWKRKEIVDGKIGHPEIHKWLQHRDPYLVYDKDIMYLGNILASLVLFEQNYMLKNNNNNKYRPRISWQSALTSFRKPETRHENDLFENTKTNPNFWNVDYGNVDYDSTLVVITRFGVSEIDLISGSSLTTGQVLSWFDNEKYASVMAASNIFLAYNKNTTR